MPTPEELFNSERPSTRIVFEHLFSGNSYSDLPFATGTEEISVFLKVYIDSLGTRNIRIASCVENNLLFVERENLKRVDKITIPYYLQDLIPQGHTIHPSYFNGTDFSNLIDMNKGEHFAGIAMRPIPVSGFRFLARWEKAQGVNPYLEKPEIVLGVLDGKGKPAAIIHYIEGNKVKGKKVEVLRAVPTAETESI